MEIMAIMYKEFVGSQFACMAQVEEEAAPAAHLLDKDGNRKEAEAPPPSGGMSESVRVSVSLETDNSLATLLDLTKVQSYRNRLSNALLKLSYQLSHSKY